MPSQQATFLLLIEELLHAYTCIVRERKRDAVSDAAWKSNSDDPCQATEWKFEISTLLY